jgi:hypothetical protein
MQRYMHIGLRTLLYWLIGTIVFLFIVNFIQFPNTEIIDNKTVIESINKETKTAKELVLSQINPSEKKIVVNEQTSSYFVFFDYVLNNNNLVIPAFYILMLLSFLLQVTLLAWSYYYSSLLEMFSQRKLEHIFLYSSEFAVNAPTVIGVMGTIFSFGMIVSLSGDIANLSSLFKENFANSALTTIIGAMVYVLNLYLNIFISKNLSIEK